MITITSMSTTIMTRPESTVPKWTRYEIPKIFVYRYHLKIIGPCLIF